MMSTRLDLQLLGINILEKTELMTNLNKLVKQNEYELKTIYNNEDLQSGYGYISNKFDLIKRQKLTKVIKNNFSTYSKKIISKLADKNGDVSLDVERNSSSSQVWTLCVNFDESTIFIEMKIQNSYFETTDISINTSALCDDEESLFLKWFEILLST